MRAAKDLPWGENDVTGSKLVIQGSYPDQFTLPYQESFRKELHILMPRDHTPADLVQAVKMIADGVCQVDDLISWFGDPAEAPEAYKLLRSDRSMMTIAFDWGKYAS
jgi:threonine dehydrogenase-like Zn-dependent dehydrogenase